MFSSFSINSTTCTMSHRGASSPSRKKLPKLRNSSSPDSIDRPKTASSTSLSTAKSDKIKNQLNVEPSNNSRSRPASDCNLSKTEQSIVNSQFSSTKILEKSWSPERSVVIEKGEEEELVDVLTRQVYLAENQMQKMQSLLKRAEERLKTKDQEIARLKRKIKDWEAKNKNQDAINKNVMQKKKMEIENSAYLYKRCLSLEHKIYEMEKFLADYGFVWIGDSKIDSSMRQDKGPNDFIENYYGRLTASIEELNMSVGKDEIQVEHNLNGGGASFKMPSCMCLKFYKNGMMIEEGKLRPYNEPNTVSFIRDILDGYFPSELQSAYPNGVPFKVEDHRTETYLLGSAGFPGQGHRLGKQALINNKHNSTASVKSTITSSVRSPKSPYVATENKKKYCYNFKTGLPSVPSSARSSKQKICPPAISVELLDLRSQILASHNNNCSHSHLQSHVNAELGFGSRTERKRTPAVKTTEYHLSVKEKPLSSRGSRTDSICQSNGKTKTSQHGSIDRSSSVFSSSRFDKSTVRLKSRSRSASLNSSRYPIRSYSRFLSPTSNDCTPRNFYHGTSGTTNKPRVTRSATLDRKSELPTVREINEATGKPGELRLKVRSMNGSTVFLMHVSADDTVAKLYQLLDKTLTKGRQRNYKIIISGYERKRLDQFGIPLRAYGISRDSVLHLVND